MLLVSISCWQRLSECKKKGNEYAQEKKKKKSAAIAPVFSVTWSFRNPADLVLNFILRLLKKVLSSINFLHLVYLL